MSFLLSLTQTCTLLHCTLAGDMCLTLVVVEFHTDISLSISDWISNALLSCTHSSRNKRLEYNVPCNLCGRYGRLAETPRRPPTTTCSSPWLFCFSPLFFCNTSCRLWVRYISPILYTNSKYVKGWTLPPPLHPTPTPHHFSPVLSPSTSMWGVYSETCIHHYNIPLAPSFTRLCIITPPPPQHHQHHHQHHYPPKCSSCNILVSLVTVYTFLSPFTKEYTSPALRPQARFVNRLKNSYLLAFIFRTEKPLYQRCNASQWLRKLDRPDTAWQRTCKFQKAKVHFDWIKRQWPNDPFPLEIFLSLSLSSVLTMVCVSIYLAAWLQFA